MRNSAKIREEIAEVTAKVEAIAELCKLENREPAADETTFIDDALNNKIPALNKDRERADKLEALQLANLQRAGASANPSKPEGTPERKSIIVPAAANRFAKLKNLKGENAKEKAYAFGQWVFGAFGNERSKEWAKDHGYEFRNAMSEGLDSKGGFLVPEEFDSMLIDLRNEYGVARREFKVVPMTSDTKVWPRRTGGLTAYFVAEAGTITASDKTLDQVRLTAKKVGAIARYSQELAEDAVISIADDLAGEIAQAFANKEDECAFNGDGTSTYGGMVGIKNALLAGSKVTAATGNTAFGTLDLEDFEAMIAKAASYTFRNGGPKWYIHRSGWALSMLRLAAAAGGNTVREIQGGSTPQFLGYDVVFVEVMNATTGAQTSTEGLCYFGNLPLGTLFGDRRGISLANSSDVYFTSDEIAIRGTERFDVNVHDVGTSSAAGCIVGLGTPGS